MKTARIDYLEQPYLIPRRRGKKHRRRKAMFLKEVVIRLRSPLNRQYVAFASASIEAWESRDFRAFLIRQLRRQVRDGLQRNPINPYDGAASL